MILDFLARSWIFLDFLAWLIAKILYNKWKNPRSWQEIQDYPRLSKILARKPRRQALGSNNYYWQAWNSSDGNKRNILYPLYIHRNLNNLSMQREIFQNTYMLNVWSFHAFQIISQYTFKNLTKDQLQCLRLKVSSVILFYVKFSYDNMSYFEKPFAGTSQLLLHQRCLHAMFAPSYNSSSSPFLLIETNTLQLIVKLPETVKLIRLRIQARSCKTGKPENFVIPKSLPKTQCLRILWSPSRFQSLEFKKNRLSPICFLQSGWNSSPWSCPTVFFSQKYQWRQSKHSKSFFDWI